MLERVRIVNSEAVHQPAAREHAIPHLLETGHTAAAEVIDLRVAIENLEEPRAFELSEIVGGSAYGAAAIAGGDGSRQLSEKELSVAKLQAKMFTNVVSTYVKGKSA